MGTGGSQLSIEFDGYSPGMFTIGGLIAYLVKP